MTSIRALDSGYSAQRGIRIPKTKGYRPAPAPPPNIIRRPLNVPPMERVKRG